MKIQRLLIAAALLPLALAAQEDRYAQITNPRLTNINKEPPRSTFTSYTNEADAVINDRKNGTFRISLNGKWKFNYVENFADRPTDFMDARTDVSRWPDIDVPGNWEVQGFGTPIYVNHPYEFCSSGYAPYWDKPNPPYVPTAVMDDIPREVAEFEPALALDGGADGLDVLRRLLPWCRRALKEGGGFAFELHETCLDEAARLAEEAGFSDVRVTADLAGRPRVLTARKRAV